MVLLSVDLFSVEVCFGSVVVLSFFLPHAIRNTAASNIETAQMTRAYLDHSEEIMTARDPLMRASELGNATRVKEILTFMPNKQSEDDRS